MLNLIRTSPDRASATSDVILDRGVNLKVEDLLPLLSAVH